MKVQEAIEYINCVFDEYFGDRCVSNTNKFAIAQNVAMEALQKQIPRELYRISGIDANDNAIVDCPVCKAGNDTSIKTIKHIYCWKCGQSLQWE